MELPDEECSYDFEDTLHDVAQMLPITEFNETSLVSARSAVRDITDKVLVNVEIDELEAIASCFDDIRLMRFSNALMSEINDDTVLGD